MSDKEKKEKMDNTITDIVVKDDEFRLPDGLGPDKYKAIQMWLTGKYRIGDIADAVDRHYMTVRNWFINDPDITAYVNDYQKYEMQLVKNKLSSATTAALEKMIALCESDNDGISIQAARDILDRSGLKPVQKVQKEINHTYEEKIKNIMEGIDIDYEVVEDDDGYSME